MKTTITLVVLLLLYSCKKENSKKITKINEIAVATNARIFVFIREFVALKGKIVSNYYQKRM